MPDSLTIIERVRLQAEPMYGWGWSYRNGKNALVPPPFSLNAVVNDSDGFKTALGRLDQPTHPLTSMWIFLSPILAGNTWSLSHVCAFDVQPSIPDSGNELLDDEGKVLVLGKVIANADITGFARVEIVPMPE